MTPDFLQQECERISNEERWYFDEEVQPEQVMMLQRQIELEIARRKTAAQACRDTNSIAQSYCHWHREYDGADRALLFLYSRFGESNEFVEIEGEDSGGEDRVGGKKETVQMRSVPCPPDVGGLAIMQKFLLWR